jgi:hypothetical protein
MHIPAVAIFWLKTKATELLNKLKAELQSLLTPEWKSAPSITVGDNNSGNIYIFNGPVNLTQSSTQLTTEPQSRPSIESN